MAMFEEYGAFRSKIKFRKKKYLLCMIYFIEKTTKKKKKNNNDKLVYSVGVFGRA